MSKEGHHLATGVPGSFVMTKSRFNTFRIVIVTSLFWVLLDAFLVIYVSDCGTSLVAPTASCLRCESRIEKLELELAASRRRYSKLLDMSSVKLKNLAEDDDDDDDDSDDAHEDVDKLSKQQRLKKRRLDKLNIFEHQSKHSSSSSDEDGIDKRILKEAQEEKEKIKGIKEWFKEEFANEVTNPPHLHGEQGRGVVIPDELKQEAESRFTENQFNIVASELIALNRSIPDQRSLA
jgi:hypothetical protein